MRKTKQIAKVVITKYRNTNMIKGYDNNGDAIKLTRTQRELFTKYRQPHLMIESIYDEFSNPKVLSKDFIIELDDTIVFDMSTFDNI